MNVEQAKSQSSEARVGEVLDGKYFIEAVLGAGGMGVVYKAKHLDLKKPVALKLLHPTMSRDTELVSRFRREAQASANIDTAHICAATDFGRTPEGEIYIAMEYLEGRTVQKARLEAGGVLAPKRVLHIARQVCRVLQKTHDIGVVHRDIKPENIMLIVRDGEPDFVKLLDFGIARVRLDDDPAITLAGKVYGTPQYLAPEQAAGAKVDGRADLYALGVVLFEMLTGRLPFVSEDSVALIRMHMMRRPPTLRQVDPNLPAALEEVVAKLLRKSADERFLSAAELSAVLDTVELGPNVLFAATPTSSTACDAPTVDLELEVPDLSPRIVRLIPRDMATRCAAVPVWKDGERLVVAMVDPSDSQAIEEIGFLTGYRIEPLGASESVVTNAIARTYDSSAVESTGSKVITDSHSGSLESEPLDAELPAIPPRASLIWALILGLATLLILTWFLVVR